MLLYGTARALRYINSDTIIFNHTGYVEYIPQINIIPPRHLGAVSEYDFDLKYYQYIMNDNIAFMEFMSKIVMNLYEGKDIFLVISEDDWSIILIESLLKVIQQRYGINGTKIETQEDLFFAEESDFDPGYGLMNLDQDKERFIYQYTSEQEKNGGNNYV